jgi:hypothetical protein
MEVALEEKKLSMEEQKFAMEEQNLAEENEKKFMFMSTDTDKMSEKQRQYVEMMRDQLLAKKQMVYMNTMRDMGGSFGPIGGGYGGMGGGFGAMGGAMGGMGGAMGGVMTHKYRGSQQSSGEVNPNLLIRHKGR